MKSLFLSYAVEEFLYKTELNENQNARKTLRYFLEKNITTLLGKNEFLLTELKIISGSKQEEIFTRIPYELHYNNYLKIICNEIIFILTFNKEQRILKFSKKNEIDGFEIHFEPDRIWNQIICNKEEETVVEYQNVGISSETYFDYQKITYTNYGEEQISIPYRIKPIYLKCGISSFFSIEELNEVAWKNESLTKWEYFKRFFRKTLESKKKGEIVQISSQDNSTDCYDNLLEIYHLFTEENYISKQTQKLAKVKK